MFATLIISSDRRGAAQTLARQRGWDVSADDVLAMPTVLIGSVEQIAEDLHHR